MNRTMIDIADLPRERINGEVANMAKAVRFATVAEPAATSDARTFTFVFSDESVDRYGDIIYARGWQLDNFNANPVALFGHDASSVENVVGRAKNVRVQGSELVGEIEFMSGDVNQNAEAVCRMVAAGFLKTVSVGFAPLEWKATKDKARPGGVDFVKQELLEISIVPIPANPNALVQAKAAGIEIERLGLAAPSTETRGAPKMVRKGLYSVSFLASILADLGYLSDSVTWEAEYEDDGSTVPAALLDAMRALGKVLVDMTAEEVAELLAGDDDDDLGMVIGMSARESRAAIARSIVKMTPVSLAGIATVARELAAGFTVHVKTAAPETFLLRQGKVISAANEKTLRDAHKHITAAAECVKSVVDPEAEDDDKTAVDDTEEKAIEERRRRAAAIRRKIRAV